MRRVRLTYKGAYHHIMSRGIRGEDIFFDNRAKIYFLDILQERAKNQRIRIFAYCIMDNHYHLILQNSTGKLSEYIKGLNGQYGMYYRKRVGGKGYVFQDRFKSTLIQEDRYMQMAILYVLLNPVRGGIVKDPWKYKWSSIGAYFTDEDTSFIDKGFAEGIFGDKRMLESLLTEWAKKDLPIRKTKMGDVLGDERFIGKATERFDRRRKKDKTKRMRRYEYNLEPVERVINDFEKQKGVEIKEIKTNTEEGKLLRNKLLVLLKDKAGLTYSEITQYQPFQELKYSSLGQLYKRTKKRKGGG